MSVHKIRPHNPAHKVEVGWSPALQTFYAQVHDLQKEKAGKDAVVKWLGRRRGEIIELKDLEQRLKPWAMIPPKMRTALAEDKAGGR